MSNPPVSVIIPTYNRSQVLFDSVQSVLGQTHENLEVIVVDDGSTDDTEALLSTIRDPRLRYHRLKENAGAPTARNIGVELARYDLIAFQDSDDRWFPHKLETQLSYLRAHPECVLIYCAFEIQDPVSGNMVKFPFDTFPREELSGSIHPLLLRRNTIDTPTMLLKKDFFLTAGSFDPALPGFQDWDLAIRLSGLGEIGYVDDILMTSISTKGGISSGKKNLIKARCMILSKYLDEYDSLQQSDNFVSDLLTYAERDHLQEYAAAMLQQHFPDRSWGNRTHPVPTPGGTTSENHHDKIYLRTLIMEESTLIRNSMQLLEQLYLSSADAIESMTEADALHIIDLSAQKSLQWIQQLFSLPNQAGYMKDALTAYQHLCTVLQKKAAKATSLHDVQEEILALGMSLNHLSAAADIEISEMQKAVGNRLFMELEALTIAVKQLQKMGLHRILDYGCALDRAGLIAKCLRNGLCFEELRIDAVSLSPDGMNTRISPGLYDRIYYSAEDIMETYDAVWIMNYRDGATMDGISRCLNQTKKLGKFIFCNILPVADHSQAVSALKEALTVFPRYAELTEESHHVFLADSTTSEYTGQIAVYAVTHKSFLCPADPMYFPIHAGSGQAAPLGYPGDHEGDNVSELNPYINECTALYWIWKNDRHSFVGLQHYRRYFSPAGMDFVSDWLPTETELLSILHDYDIILGYPGYIYPATVEQHYRELFHQSDACITALQIMRDQISEIQPAYLDSYDQILLGHTVYLCNLFITSHDIMDSYCRWLFSFLIEAVQRTNKILGDNGYRDTFDRRAVGFLAERLLSVWLQHQQLRIKYLPVVSGNNV